MSLDDRTHAKINAEKKSDGQELEPAEQTNDEIILKLAALRPLEYDKRRKDSAKQLGISVKALDAEIKAIQGRQDEADDLPFDEVEPYHDEVNPAELLSEISDTLSQFIIMNQQQADVSALWLAMTWFIDDIGLAPLLIINAPEKSCGKTQLLSLMARMAYRPLSTDNASPSSMFRAVDAWKPTLFIDEADTFFRDNQELHGMVNAGYARTGFVLRTEESGGTFKVKRYPVFSAKAITGIALEKHLPDATMSRGIVINLRRKLPHETVARLRHADTGIFDGLASRLARFADDYSQQVKAARPELSESLTDREQDNFEPLLAIASCAGDEWLGRANRAALALSGNEESRSISNELLADIRDIFEGKRLSHIRTAELITLLCEDEENAWATYNRGKPISARQLNRQLGKYGIESKQIRLNSNDRIRGFEHVDFREIFERYLPDKKESREHPEKTCDSVTNTLKPSNHEGYSVTSSENCHVTTCDKPTQGNESVTQNHVTEKALCDAESLDIAGFDPSCHAVTPKIGVRETHSFNYDSEAEV